MKFEDISVDDILKLEYNGETVNCHVIGKGKTISFGIIFAFDQLPHKIYSIKISIDNVVACRGNPNYQLSDKIEQYIGKFGCNWSQLDNLSPIDNKQIISGGCNCKDCGEFYPMAVNNQADGSMVCWSCRNYPMRKYY